MNAAGTQTKVVTYYAVWVALCAAGAGAITSIVHLLFFSHVPSPSAGLQILFGGLATTLAVAAGQGAVALCVGSLLVQLGRTLRYTVLLGLLIGVFDLGMYLLQMIVPATELGWAPDIVILAGATAAITLLGQARAESAGI